MKSLKAGQNINGFSLVEILIVLSIFSVVALGISGMFLNSLKTQRGMTLTDQMENNLFEIKMVLSNASACQSNLSNLSISPPVFDADHPQGDDYPGANFSQILPLASTTPVFVNNKPLGYNPTTTASYAPGTSMSVSLADVKPIQPGSLYLANLNFSLNKDAQNSAMVSGPTNIVRRLPIVLQTHTVGPGNTQSIDSCYTFNSTLTATDVQTIEAATCTSLGGTFSGGACTLPPVPTPAPAPPGPIGNIGVQAVGSFTYTKVPGGEDPGPSVPNCPPTLTMASPCAGTETSTCKFNGGPGWGWLLGHCPVLPPGSPGDGGGDGAGE